MGNKEKVKLPKLVCSICKGTNVHTRAWVDANTHEYKGDISVDDVDNWCDDCKVHDKLIIRRR